MKKYIIGAFVVSMGIIGTMHLDSLALYQNATNFNGTLTISALEKLPIFYEMKKDQSGNVIDGSKVRVEGENTILEKEAGAGVQFNGVNFPNGYIASANITSINPLALKNVGFFFNGDTSVSHNSIFYEMIGYGCMFDSNGNFIIRAMNMQHGYDVHKYGSIGPKLLTINKDKLPAINISKGIKFDVFVKFNNAYEISVKVAVNGVIINNSPLMIYGNYGTYFGGATQMSIFVSSFGKETSLIYNGLAVQAWKPTW